MIIVKPADMAKRKSSIDGGVGHSPATRRSASPEVQGFRKNWRAGSRSGRSRTGAPAGEVGVRRG